MKFQTYLVVAGVLVGAFSVSTLVAKQPSKPAKRGTDILHWSVRANMSNEDTNSNGSASVSLKQNKQGKANNQRVDLRVEGLEADTQYYLWALVGDDTNYVQVTDFTTDSKGKAKLKMMSVGSSKGKGLGKGKKALVGELNPISNLSGLAIANVSTQAVFTADLTSPDKLQYLVKRSFDEGDVQAFMRLQATTSKLKFQLYLWGLSATNEYHLAVNDETVASGNSDENGNLSFPELPVAVGDILGVHSLAVWDSATNSVISTTLP